MSLLRQFVRDVRLWQRSAQLSLALALLGLALAALAAAVWPEQRRNALIAAGGFIFVAQVIVLWGNRVLLTPLARAQRLFLRGDVAGVVALLEPLCLPLDARKADARTLTVLGNAYRQVGRLDDSAAVLRAAVDKESSHHFPRYGFGRTLLAQGEYAAATRQLQHALDLGAPPATQFDLGEAYYRLGDAAQAQQHLQAVRPALTEPYRQLMADYLLYRLGAGPAPVATADGITAGLALWQTLAAQYHSAYGAVLRQDVAALQALTRADGAADGSQ
jgi:tetratricopeptide (TPR) repeat protein